MADLIGYISILLVFLFTLVLTYRNPNISRILIVALLSRVIFLLLGHNFISLPDSTADAESFEELAWNLAKNGLPYVLQNFEGPDPYFISWFLAIPYSIFGRSILMAKSLSLFFGIGSVFLGFLVVQRLWNNDIAKKAGWVMALFPSLILYSVLTMREVYICFFLMTAIYGIVSWFKTNNFKSF